LNRHNRDLERIVLSALRRPAAERAAYVAETCGTDEELRREVESLIARDQAAASFLEVPPVSSALSLMVAATGPTMTQGDRIGPYTVVSSLGCGGMGEVYRARDATLGREVAIKVLPSIFTTDPQRLGRFEREARLLASLNHPNIATIHGVEHANGIYALVLELVEGETLAERLRSTAGYCSTRSGLPLASVLSIARQIVDALEPAHAKGIVHRDLKPANVMIRPDGVVKLLDFGLAKTAADDGCFEPSSAIVPRTGSTDDGVIVGTAAYMSPEQARGHPVDRRTDVWAFGCVLYEMLTGGKAFGGRTTSDVLASILGTEPDFDAVPPETPDGVRRLLRRALTKDPRNRLRDIGDARLELIEMLGASSAGSGTGRSLLDALRGLRDSASVSVFGVGNADTPSVADTPEAFVGREPELKRLEGFLRQAIEGTGRVVFITGEAGIGKTALADEFLRRARQQRVVLCRGRCAEQYGPGEAYLPFLDALGALVKGPGGEHIAAVMRIQAPTWCLQLPAVLASPGALEQLLRETIGATKERMMREMSDLLSAVAASTPIVLLLEDLHWADASSVDLLRRLSDRAREQRLLVIGTFRPEDLAVGNHPLKNSKREMDAHQACEELALGSLHSDHIAAYLDRRFSPNSFPPALATLIESRTEGHPLFATSLVHLLEQSGHITKTNDHWTLRRALSEMDLEVPESVRGMIRKKIEVLEEEDRRALQYGSIEGEEFTSNVVAHLLGIDDLALEERLDRLDRMHRLIVTLGEEEWPDGTLAVRYRFAHALYQNILYADLVGKRRSLLHRQVGEQLATRHGDAANRIATQLAMHFERGRDFSNAITYLIHAGGNANKVYANAEAEQHYSRALALVDKLPDPERAEKYLSLYLKRGTANHSMSRFQQAVEDFTQTLDKARATASPHMEGEALIALANTLLISHRMEEMQARADDLLRVADACGRDMMRAAALLFIGLKHICYGELVAGKPLLDQAISVSRASGDKAGLANALQYRSFVHFFQSEYDHAEAMMAEASDLGSELRDGFLLLQCLFGMSLILGNMGQMSKALRTLDEAMQMAQRNGDHYTLSKIPNCIGWIYRELQNFQEAQRHDERGVELARADHVLEAEANSLINLGYGYTATGGDEKALSAFREVSAIFARDDWLRWRYNIRLQAGQAEYWLVRGKLNEAEEYARRLLETATQHETHKYVAVAHKLRAEVALARGDFVAGEKELVTALGVLQQYPVPIVAWKTYVVLGRLQVKSGKHSAARQAFGEAAAIVARIAANVTDDTLRSTFLGSAAVREVASGVN
jgi:serine/threonine protein kinase/tetratricopeptide (TPR) repeat protein